MDGKYVSLSKGGLGAGICGDGLMQQTLSIHGGTTPVIGVGSKTWIYEDKIQTPLLVQTSKESIKKNFEKINNAIGIIKNSEIYKYNFKLENDKDKKHIGFVIPDLGGEFKTPSEVILGDGIDTYSMISVLWKAVQEQQEKIEKLEETIANNVKK